MPSRQPRELFRELGGLSDYQRGLVRRWLSGTSLNALPKGAQSDAVRRTLRGYSRQQVTDAYEVYRFNARQLAAGQRGVKRVAPTKYTRGSIEISPVTLANLRAGTAEVGGSRLTVIIKAKWGPSERINADGQIVTRDVTHVQTKLTRREWEAAVESLPEYETVEAWAQDVVGADEAPEDVESVYLIGR